MNSNSERVSQRSQRSQRSGEYNSVRSGRSGRSGGSYEPVQQYDSQRQVSTAQSVSGPPGSAVGSVSHVPSTALSLNQSSAQSTTMRANSGVGTNLCCCSVFMWVKILGVLFLLFSLAGVGGAYFTLDADVYFHHQRAVTGGIAGLGVLLSVAVLANAFAIHRAIIYLVLGVIQIIIAVIVLSLAALVIFVFAVEFVDCKRRIGDDCYTTAVVCIAASSFISLVGVTFEVLYTFVLIKAAFCQKDDDGFAIP